MKNLSAANDFFPANDMPPEMADFVIYHCSEACPNPEKGVGVAINPNPHEGSASGILLAYEGDKALIAIEAEPDEEGAVTLRARFEGASRLVTTRLIAAPKFDVRQFPPGEFVDRYNARSVEKWDFYHRLLAAYQIRPPSASINM